MMINGSLNVRANGSASWKVGVIRVGRLREKFVHKELLVPGLDPGPRVNELVDRDHARDSHLTKLTTITAASSLGLSGHGRTVPRFADKLGG